MTVPGLQMPRPQQPVAWTEFKRHETPDATAWTLFYRTPSGYLLRFPTFADFEISQEGLEVSCIPVPGVDAATLEHLYLNQVYPLMKSRQGLPAFHASVVTSDEGAVAFLGTSGMGKSTLAAWFCRNGSQFLTDDGMLVETRGQHWVVVPNQPSIRLWEDSIAALFDNIYVPAKPVSFTSKERLLAVNNNLNWCNEGKRLRAAFILQQNGVDAIATTPLNGIPKVMAWVNNSFVLDPEDTASLLSHFQWVQRLCAEVPLWQLDYPRDYHQLPAVAATVRTLVQRAGG